MKVYIPFNSNDFNSVFTTLSISPASFYSGRKYSFRRATTTYLNENEDFLIGFNQCLFHTREFDKDYGFPVLIETEIDKSESDWQKLSGEIKYTIIDNTVNLFEKFKLIFRSEKEKNETLAKSLKSIETKFAQLAKLNCDVVSSECFVNQMPVITYPDYNHHISTKVFYKERKINRLFGAILGSSIASSNYTSKEWQDILNLLRLLNNNLSLFINKIGDNNEFQKKSVLEIISNIETIHGQIEKLEEAIMLGSDSSFNTEILSALKNSKIFNIPVFNLLIEGMLSTPKLDLPISLKIEKLRRAIIAKYNSKYPNTYIDRIESTFSSLKMAVDEEVRQQRKNIKLTSDVLVKPYLSNGKLKVTLPSSISNHEKIYLELTLCYFIENDSISDVEYFFTNRKEILVDLAKFFREHIEQFDGSNEREYLLELLKSFESLRGGFNISKTSNDVLRSIAVLFTSGRDLLRYIENNEREEIQNSLIYYTIWGSIYGAAIFPKTLTESITEDDENTKTLIESFRHLINEYNWDYTIEKQTEEKSTPNTPINDLKSSDKNNENPVDSQSHSVVSVLGYQILEKVEQLKKVKFSDLKNVSKTLKTNSDIEKLIKEQLLDKIKITKKGATMYAEVLNDNELKFE